MERDRRDRVYRAFSELIIALAGYLEESDADERDRLAGILGPIYQARISFTRATRAAEPRQVTG